MKLLICIALLIAYSYAQDSDNGEVSYIPDNAPLHMTFHKMVTKCVHNNRSVTITPGAISLIFHDFDNNINKSFPIETAGADILNIEGLDKTNKFVFIIPGYTKGITEYSMNLIEDSFKGLNTYVIIYDDPVYTNMFITKYVAFNYEKGVAHTTKIARSLADVAANLTRSGVSPMSLHFIGHSLGAHIAGYTAEFFKEITGFFVFRVTGLDPSGPCFEDRSNHVRKGQAIFVDIYHSNIYELGSRHHFGDVNDILNNGVIQPKCFASTSTANGTSAGTAAAICSHMSSQNFFFATVRQPDLFPSYKCESYGMFKRGECQNNERTVVGYWIPINATGLFYTSTVHTDIHQL